MRRAHCVLCCGTRRLCCRDESLQRAHAIHPILKVYSPYLPSQMTSSCTHCYNLTMSKLVNEINPGGYKMEVIGQQHSHLHISLIYKLLQICHLQYTPPRLIHLGMAIYTSPPSQVTVQVQVRVQVRVQLQHHGSLSQQPLIPQASRKHPFILAMLPLVMNHLEKPGMLWRFNPRSAWPAGLKTFCGNFIGCDGGFL